MHNLFVIFDMDGVIFDTERAILDCWIEASRAYPVSESLVRETFIKCIGTNNAQTTEIYNSTFSGILSPDDRESLWNESYGMFRSKYEGKCLPVKPGANEILEFLRARGIRTGLATSTRKDIATRELQDADLLQYFESITGGDSVRISKPDPEIYLLACKKMDVKPSDTMAIEDSYNGIRSAHAAGMRPIMVPDMVPADEEMMRLSESVCPDLFAVIDYIRGFIQ